MKPSDRRSCLLSGYGLQHCFHCAHTNRVCFCTSSWSLSSTQCTSYSCFSTRFDLVTVLPAVPQQWYNFTTTCHQNQAWLHTLIAVNQVRADPGLSTTFHRSLRYSVSFSAYEPKYPKTFDDMRQLFELLRLTDTVECVQVSFNTVRTFTRFPSTTDQPKTTPAPDSLNDHSFANILQFPRHAVTSH